MELSKVNCCVLITFLFAVPNLGAVPSSPKTGYYIFADSHLGLFKALCGTSDPIGSNVGLVLCLIRGKSPLDNWSIPRNSCMLLKTTPKSDTACFIYFHDSLDENKYGSLVNIYREVDLSLRFELLRTLRLHSHIRTSNEAFDPSAKTSIGNVDTTDVFDSAPLFSFFQNTTPVSTATTAMKDYWSSCVNLTFDICRSHQLFTVALKLLYYDDLPGVLAVKPISNIAAASVENAIVEDADQITVKIPNVTQLDNIISNAMHSNMAEYTKTIFISLEEQLYYRECLLINEFEEMLIDTSMFMLDIYTLVQDHIIQVMGGYYHMASLMRRNLKAILENIKIMEIGQMSAEVSKWYAEVDKMDKLLKVPLKGLLGDEEYEEMEEAAKKYIEAWEDMETIYAFNTQSGGSVGLTKETTSAHATLHTLLSTSLELTSKYGNEHTKAFFVDGENAFKHKAKKPKP